MSLLLLFFDKYYHFWHKWTGSSSGPRNFINTLSSWHYHALLTSYVYNTSKVTHISPDAFSMQIKILLFNQQVKLNSNIKNAHEIL